MSNKKQYHGIIIGAAMILFCITSCNESKTTKQDIAESTSLSTSKVIQSPIDGDPSFEKSLDTISVFGPHSITRNVLQDKNGNIWLACWEGIIQYDGKKFTNFTLKYGLRQYHTFSILEDSKGNLWFGTIGGGVYKYDGNYFSNFTTEHQLGGNKVFCIAEDKTGNIWFGTDNGASCYNGNTFINYSTQHGLSNNFVSTITEDKSGLLWIGTNSGIDRYDGKSFTKFKIGTDFSFTNVRSIMEGKNENMWISCQNGVFRFDGKSISSITPNFAGCIFEDKIGNIWFSESVADGSEMMLIRYDGKTMTEIARSKQVFGITEDRAENIWFGTASGVQRYDGKSFVNFGKITN